MMDEFCDLPLMDEEDRGYKTEAESGNKLVEAARQADWVKVIANGGPPCFHLQDYGRFCLRAERWPGHDGWEDHAFVSLADLIAKLAKGATA